MTIGLYAVINKHSKLAYIGSSKNVEQRLINHKSYINTGCKHPSTISALRGTDASCKDFEFRLLKAVGSIQEARELETSFLECFLHDGLYNVSSSANGATGVKRDFLAYSAGAKKQWANPEQRNKKMQAMRGKRKIVICPHCNVSGGGGNMRRYHFDNCKQK